MSETQTIKDLYVLALAEGEGIGTAYEYYAKRLAMLPWLKDGARPKRLLVAGLPQKYGSSLDFLLLGAEMGCQVTVIDERQAALTKLARVLKDLAAARYSPELRANLYQTGDICTLTELSGQFDLILSSEVLQRLDPDQRAAYVERLQGLSQRIALFAPNADNDAHVGLSGLGGVQLNELAVLMGQDSAAASRSDYIDMPPFPPGITRTSTQREDATTGTGEAFAMWGLGVYARIERFIPAAVRRKWAHIVFGLYGPRQR